jgi:hypothetical protein
MGGPGGGGGGEMPSMPLSSSLSQIPFSSLSFKVYAKLLPILFLAFQPNWTIYLKTFTRDNQIWHMRQLDMAYETTRYGIWDNQIWHMRQPDMADETTRYGIWDNQIWHMRQPDMAYETTRYGIWDNQIWHIRQLDMAKPKNLYVYDYEQRPTLCSERGM